MKKRKPEKKPKPPKPPKDERNTLPAQPAADMEPVVLLSYLWHYPTRLDADVDGDTLQLFVDDGHKNYGRRRYRLAGIDVWEVTGKQKPLGLRALADARAWCARADADFRARYPGVPDKDVYPIMIRTYYHVGRTGAWTQDETVGRWVADAWSFATGESLALYLDRRGHRKDLARLDELLALLTKEPSS